MPNRRRFLLTALAAVMALSVVTPAFADTPAPMSSYKRTSQTGAYVFVMLGRPDFGSESVGEWEGYTLSGLYRNDGSKDPIWTVDWYAYNVDVSMDGVHLVRHGGPTSGLDGEAISFYANGELIRGYTVRDLVDDERGLTRSMTFLHWRRDGRFVDLRHEYMLFTLDGNAFTFDITSGEIVREFRAVPSR